MTTPERLRRRQRIEGTALVLFALFSTATMFYLDSRNDDEIEQQRECLVQVTSDLIAVIESGREASLTEQTGDRHLILGALSGKITTPEEVALAMKRYRHHVDEAKHLRRSAPIPPDPAKVCR